MRGSFPEGDQRRVRTTNEPQRLNQEIKRRMRVVRIFTNREVCLRLVTALAVEQSQEWLTGRHYLDMDELRERRRQEREGEEVTLVELQNLRDLAEEHGCELKTLHDYGDKRITVQRGQSCAVSRPGSPSTSGAEGSGVDCKEMLQNAI